MSSCSAVYLLMTQNVLLLLVMAREFTVLTTSIVGKVMEIGTLIYDCKTCAISITNTFFVQRDSRLVMFKVLSTE